MDDEELEEAFGFYTCHYLSHEFVRKHLRLVEENNQVMEPAAEVVDDSDVSIELSSSDNANANPSNVDHNDMPGEQVSLQHDEQASQASTANDEQQQQINTDLICDSIEVGRSKYFRKKKNAVALKAVAEAESNRRDSHMQALDDLDLIMRPHATSAEQQNAFKGKKIQLRPNRKRGKTSLQIESDDESDNISVASSVGSESTVASTASTRAQFNRIFNNKAKHAYTIDEDNNILKYIIQSERYAEIKGIQLWRDMANEKVNVDRSWQSMKERFRKHIANNLAVYVEMYHLEDRVVELLEDNINYESAGTTKAKRARRAAAESDAEADTSTASRTTTSKNLPSNSYSREEDEEIVKCIFSEDINSSILGRSIWIKLEKHFARNFIGKKRTWQSLKERFVKRICPQIYKYQNVKDYDKACFLVDRCCPSLDDRAKIKEKLLRRFNRN